MNNYRRRVAITGLGWVTSLGHSVDEVWPQLLAGTSGITAITRFDASKYTTQICGEVRQWEAPHLERRSARRLDRFAQFALNAACLLYTSPSPRDGLLSRMPSSA